MVSLAVVNSGVGSGVFRCRHCAFRHDERPEIICTATSRQTISRRSGDRLLVAHLRGRLWHLFDSDHALTLREANALMVTGLDLLFLEVNNLEESILFYHEQLGFEIESHNPEAEPPIASVRVGLLRLTLVQQLETMLKRGRGVHFVFGVGDVDQFHEQLRSSSVQVSEPRDEGWGGRFVSLQDPDGYRLFFVTWRK